MKRILLSCLLTACLLLGQVAAFADVLSSTTVPNANMMIYLDESFLKPLLDTGFCLVKAIDDPEIKNNVQPIAGIIESLEIQKIQISMAAREKVPVPAVCIAIQFKNTIDLQAIQKCLLAIDRNPLQVTAGDGKAFSLGAGVISVFTAADNHVLLITTTMEVPVIKAQIEKDAGFVFPPEATANLNTNGFYYVILRQTPAAQSFLKRMTRGLRDLPLPQTVNACEYVDGPKQHLTMTATFNSEAEVAAWLEHNDFNLTKIKQFIPYLSITQKGNQLAAEYVVQTERSILESALPIYGAMILPALSKARERAQSISCINNIKQLNLGLMMYLTDNNDLFPAAEGWESALKGYVVDDKTYNCPTSKTHYTYYGKAVAINTIKNPSRTIVLVCEGHPRGELILGFADGHVEAQRARNLQECLKKHPNFKLLKDL